MLYSYTLARSTWAARHKGINEVESVTAIRFAVVGHDNLVVDHDNESMCNNEKMERENILPNGAHDPIGIACYVKSKERIDETW